MGDRVQLLGLDFGTTTSSAIVAEARLIRNAVTRRTDLDEVHERFRSELIFTPLRGGRIDEAAIACHIDHWLDAGGVRACDLFGGGALLTGLTAQRENADALVSLIRARLSDALIATADDPCLESWLAFMGSVAELSRCHPDSTLVNLDIGGGTTNIALGRAGEVLRTGCLFIGARHVQVEPGTYRLAGMSRYAQALFDHLGIRRSIGESLTDAEVDAVLTFSIDLLEAALQGNRTCFEHPVARLHEQVPFRPLGHGPTNLTLSGGVGELVYAHLEGGPWPTTTAFGDLGVDLARRLAARWSEELRQLRPTSAGRATVYGLLRHSTEISGSTLYLPRPELLPLADLPIIGSVAAATSDEDLRALIELVARSPRGGCLRVEVGSLQAAHVQALGLRLRKALGGAFPADRPLVLLVRENLGKVLGQLVTSWGARSIQLVVIDEVPTRDAQYARIGRLRQHVVPVSFYGMR